MNLRFGLDFDIVFMYFELKTYRTALCRYCPLQFNTIIDGVKYVAVSASVVSAVAVVIGYKTLILDNRSGQVAINPATIATNARTSPRPATHQATFDKSKYSLTDPASIWIVVNKSRALPNNYRPSDLVTPAVELRLSAAAEEMHLRAEAATALVQLFAAAKNQSINLILNSGFRSQTSQNFLFNSYVARDGLSAAARYSARPGHSEHQTGLAADIQSASGKCALEQCFGETIEGKWLAANVYKFGFIIRYQKDKEAVTGYSYEPWHIRYVGTYLSNQMHSAHMTTLEEFFGL